MRLNVYATAVASLLLLACMQAPASASGWWLKWDDGADEQCFGVALDAGGNTVAVGYHNPSGNNIWRVAKYDAAGTLLWSQTSGPSSGSDARGVATDAAGNIYVCGLCVGTGGSDWKVVKYDPNGTVLVDSVFATADVNDVAYGIATDPSGNVVVVGYANSTGNNQWTVMKLSPSLGHLWQVTSGPSSGSDARGVATDAAGNIYVCGFCVGTGGSDWKVVKYDPSGTVLVDSVFATADVNDAAYGIATDPSGNVVVVGYANSTGNNQWTVSKLSPSLGHLWQATSGPDSGSDARGVATDAAGNIYVCGFCVGTGGADWKIIKYDAVGNVVKEANVDALGPANEVAYGIAVRQGYCAVGGTCGSEGAQDWALWHYDTDNLGVAEGTPTRGPRPLASVICSPNPFARQTQIGYSLPNETDVVLKVCNSAGRVITTLADCRQSAGKYTVPWNVSRVPRSALPNGTYFCRLEAGEYTATRKVVKTD